MSDITFRDAGVSIVGLGVKLPGANDKIEFFDMLKNKRDGFNTVPADRWNAEKMTDKGSIPAKVCTDRGAFLTDIDEFDNLEFGISPKEAKEMDRHQMILLKTVLQAFEDSGMAYRGSKCGVFVAGSVDAHNIERDEMSANAYTSTGLALSIQANRLSYFFDLQGPSLFLDTACSGGLTAIHMARNSILAGDCDSAVVAGVTIMLSPHTSQSFSKLGTLSPEGVCRAFDADAKGYVRGEGCAVVILKKTSGAVQDDNHIYAEISGSGISANGHGTSLTMPEGKAQMATTAAAYAQSGRSPIDAAYVECHGTGTNVGDPIEVNGLGTLFSPGRTEEDRLSIGSVKTNVGHLECAAGLVSLVKACLTLDSGLLFPSLNFKTPNPKIKWNEFKIKVQTEVEPIPAAKITKDGKFVVSISSYGFGGSNSHLVLERKARSVVTSVPFKDTDPFLMAVGGMTSKSTGNVATAFKEAFKSTMDVSSAALLARVVTERARAHTLMSYAVGTFNSDLTFSDQKAANAQDLNPMKLFVFSGQGPQHDDMGRKLFARYPAFRKSIQKSDDVLQQFANKSFVRDFGFFDTDAKTSVPLDKNGVWPVEFIVISIAMFQIALFDLWVDVGLVPDAVAGHSVGEIAALYASGAISQSQAIRLAIARANALDLLHTVNGSMAALGISSLEAQSLIKDVLHGKGLDEGLWLSAENSVNAVSVSGREDLIVDLVQEADRRQIFARQLRVGGPYHSPMVDICETSFIDEVKPLLDSTSNVPTLIYVSTVDGEVHAKGKQLGSQYCWDNVRKPVLFKPALDAFHAIAQEENRNVVIVEIAPHGVLSSYIDEISKAAGADENRTTIVSCARRANKKVGETSFTPAEVSQFLGAAGGVMAAGVRNLNICKLQGLENVDLELGYSTARLPPYPLQKIQHGEAFEDPSSRQRRLIYTPTPLCSNLFRMSPLTHTWTLGHQVRGAIVVPGAAYLEAAFESGARTLKNVKIHRALILDEESEPRYVGFRQTGVQGQWQFRSASKITTDDAGVILDTLHCSGEASPEPSTVGPKDATELLGESFLDDFDLELPKEEFYSLINSTGSSYTREFAMINKIKSSTKRANHFICEVDPLPDLWTTKEARGMCIHPGLLDSLHLATWLFAFSFGENSAGKMILDNYMPSSYDEVSLLVDPKELQTTKRFLVHFEKLEINHKVSLNDMTLFDRDTGKSLLIVRGLDAPLVRQDVGHIDAYTEVWEPKSLSVGDDYEPELTLEEEEAVLSMSELDNFSASHQRHSFEAQEIVERIYSLKEVRQSLFDSSSSFLKDVINLAVSKQKRKVIRVLEVYAHQKKLHLASLASFASKIGVHLEVVPLNVAKGSHESPAGPYSVSHAAEEAGERVRPASFDIIFGVDILRSSNSQADTLQALDALLVPGGFNYLAELSGKDALTSPAYYGDEVPESVTDAVASISGQLHTVTVTRRMMPWLRSERYSISSSPDSFASSEPLTGQVTPKSSSSNSGQEDGLDTPSTPPPVEGSDEFGSQEIVNAFEKLADRSTVRMIDESTFVYYYRPDTEMDLVAAVRNLGDNPNGKIWISCDDSPDGSRGLALSGTLTNELPGVKSYGVAFSSEVTLYQRDALLQRLIDIEATGAVEGFTLIRRGAIYQRRIVKSPSIKAKSSKGGWVLELSDKMPTACVESLVPHRYLPQPLEEDQVMISTEAVALNFKNVLSATGLLPPHDRLSEFAGKVVAVGDKVTRFQIGDRVMGSDNGDREGTRAMTGEYALTSIPDNMTTQDAAAFPIVYGTVWYGLIQLAHVQKGDAILIHAAAGGVGLCAIQVAQRLELDIFCTVGSQEKRDYLHDNFGVPYSNMSNSRSIAQWTGDGRQWCKRLGKSGFDVVLNSLQGAALQAGLDSLGEIGRFVDISKRDHLAGSPMSMKHFAKAISYFAIELGLLGNNYPRRMALLMDEVATEHAKQPFHHLIGHSFKGTDGLLEAYTLMESGKHIGKIVVDLSDECKEGATTDVLPSKGIYDPRKSYVLLGGCGGLGPRLVLDMIKKGARKIVITGRRGKLDLVEIRMIDAMAKDKLYAGTDVRIMAADALNDGDMTKVFDTASSMAMLGGIFVMAVTLADDQFVNMDTAKFKKVTDSKIGILNIVRRQVDVPSLDFLFLFSSTAALYFNPGQANYNAAQAYFNRLAADHDNIISFAVPAISDVGVFAQLLASKGGNSTATKAMLALACTSRELCDRIADAISRTTNNQAVSYYIPDNLDWTVSYNTADSCRTAFAHLAEHHDEDEEGGGGLKDGEKLDPVLITLSKLLNLQLDDIDDSALLSSLGLDSLSASRLSSVLSSEYHVKLTQLQLLGPVSVSALRNIVSMTTDSAQEEGGAAAAAAVDAKNNEKKAAKIASLGSVDYAADVGKFDKEANTGEQLGPFDISKIHVDNADLCVLITGGTGYLGSAAVNAVSSHLPLARLTLLLRGSTVEDARRRLKGAFEKNAWNGSILSRVHIVLGDVTKPRLGLSEQDWSLLADQTDLVIQAHGRADHLAGYQTLSDVNAFSTSQVLKLTNTTKAKALCYFGSINMWVTFGEAANYGKMVYEDFDLSKLSTSLSSGYQKTKWVSENLVLAARKRGQTVLVVRPGTLGGKAMNDAKDFLDHRAKDSFISLFISGVEQFGVAPIIDVNASETPSDWFAFIFGRLLKKPDAWKDSYPAFHIKSPHKMVDRHSSSRVFQELPLDEWLIKFKAYILTEEGKTNRLAPLADLLENVNSLPSFDMSNTQSLLGKDYVEAPATSQNA
ncbi:hypothetical protein CBS101457_002433 [Exobasidium rhododendri]|nr:hypothetical protein CBS101457_002433 [Exobasidium rhododendri]